jgi:protease-4
MVAFLRWGKNIGLGVLNGIAKLALFLILAVVVLIVVGMLRGDGLPKTMVLALDLRAPLTDSNAGASPFTAQPVTVMDIVLALDAAEHDPRIKGVVMRIGSASLPVAQAEEIGAALKKFRASGRFVVAHSQGFDSAGLGDYVTAAAADEIWMQPHAPFTAAGEGGTAIFLRGLLDKINAVPQIVKRADYKSAADQLMEKTMTPADRVQTTRLMQSWYDSAVADAAADRHLTHDKVVAALEASPQMTEGARAAGLIDRIGFDDDAQDASLKRAGDGAKLVPFAQYVRIRRELEEAGAGPRVALVEATGEIFDGGSGGNAGVIAGDDMSKAIRQATADKDVRAIILRVDSPGGSVTASDQILDAVRKAQKAGKPVVVSMGGLAASGGYYISLSANRIVAEPGTITGSIGVLTGKVSIDKSLQLAGVGTDTIGVGKNALYNSEFQPYTDDQLAALNREADAIYADFTSKVAAGRKLPLAKVQDIAKGRVWSGADAQGQGLVDDLGGFWIATDDAKKLAGIGADEHVTFRIYPRKKGFFEALGQLMGNEPDAVRALATFERLMDAEPVKTLSGAVSDLPRGGVEMRAVNLPR